ncbi:MAG: biotin--[acetyl-CoA-carboxylase] ligase [Gammaproteobacteria bacterium 28-57-27]|nr:MAG: biotin--[acetyl-CoA-carboxylase] ligase [Gammaproteobacteria bacterium 28-57-27]
MWSQALQHLADGCWHSLTSAASRLHVSPENLRAALRQFMDLGAPVQCDPYRGVRFVQPVTPLRHLGGRFPVPVRELFMTDSTNTRALYALGAGLARRKAWVAEFQTLGRGRAQRRWHQGLGCGVSVSLAFPASDGVSLEALSLRVGLALAAAVQRLGVRGAGLKWPNDLLCQEKGQGKKLGGILIEARRAGVVVGIGVNHLRLRHQASAITQPITSLQELLGARCPARSRVLREILRAVLRELKDVSATWRTRFARFDVLKGQTIRVIEAENNAWCGVAEGVDAQGCLRVSTAQGIRVCRAGEVSVRLSESVQE